MGIEPQPSEVSKKAIKNVRKIEIPTDTPTVLELGDTAADIQRRRKEREGEEPGKTTEEGGSQSEMDTEGGGESSASNKCQRICYGKLSQSKSGQALKDMTDRQKSL